MKRFRACAILIAAVILSITGIAAAGPVKISGETKVEPYISTRYMLPSLAACNRADRGNGHAQFKSELSLRCLADLQSMQNGTDDGFCELSAALSFSSSYTTMLDNISHIFQLCSPAEIGKIVVIRVSIHMATLQSLWASSDKCFQDNPMDRLCAGWSSQTNGLVMFASIRFKLPPFITKSWRRTMSPATPNSAIVASTVAGASWNVFESY